MRFSRRWQALRLQQFVREDIRDLTQIQQIDQMETLVRLLAQRSAHPLIYGEAPRRVNRVERHDDREVLEICHRREQALHPRGGGRDLLDGRYRPVYLRGVGSARAGAVATIAGRTFGPPFVDYLLIGGGLSLLFTVAIVFSRGAGPVIGWETLPYFLLLSNAAHFAASTVRLYTKPGSFRSLPFLTLVFPLVSLVVLTICIAGAPRLGPHFQSLYLSWSPYHYAAQAYGLAVMHSFRSGCALSPLDKNLLWWVSMWPFLYNFTTAPEVGLDWLVPAGVLQIPLIAGGRSVLGYVLFALAVATPLLLYARVWRSASGPMPLISIMAVMANGVWFLVLGPLDAFVWATVFHGIQYLAIVIVFHVKDQTSQPGNRHGALYHAMWFYGASLVLAYGMFNLLPMAFVFTGFGKVESALTVVAAINIHHFIVDAYIWRLKKGDRNRTIVDAGAPAYSPSPT